MRAQAPVKKEGKIEGEIKGKIEGKIEMIVDLFNDGEISVQNAVNRLLSLNCDIETISDVTGLSESEINEIKNQE